MENMDTIDKFVILCACLFILSMVVQLGTQCASAVWQRTTADLDDIDFLEGNTVPMTTAAEALLITVAAWLKICASLPFTLARALRRPAWRLSPELRLMRLRISLRSDILLAVFSMISGYPERAGLLYLDALRERIGHNHKPAPAKLAT